MTSPAPLTINLGGSTDCCQTKRFLAYMVAAVDSAAACMEACKRIRCWIDLRVSKAEQGMETGRNLVDGALIAGDAWIEVRDPGTGAIVGNTAAASAAQADDAVAAANRIARAWADEPDRPAMLRAAAEAIDSHAEELARSLTSEQGKPLAEARTEVGRAALWLRHYAAADLGATAILDGDQRRVEVVRRPVGPVLAITPWNFPLSLLAWKLAPALAAGNPVVIKPSPLTPLSTQRLGSLLAPIFPPGVLSVLAGDAALGRHLVTHPGIAKIAFTGSTATGRAIMADAGPALKRVTLELGGNDAAIVLDDADPDAIADRLYRSAFANCGQVCIAVKRLFVHGTLMAPIVERLAARADRAIVGHGLDPATVMGPVNNARQLAYVETLVEGARRNGARIAAGGRRLASDGNYYRPTIVVDVDPDDPLVTEEQFGPALPVIGYDDVDDALAMAERGPYGLGASIWTADAVRARAIASRLTVGTVWINHHMEARPDAPFGGAKASGLGYENGVPGLDEYCRFQVINEWRS